jgi:hypothetical protein
MFWRTSTLAEIKCITKDELAQDLKEAGVTMSEERLTDEIAKCLASHRSVVLCTLQKHTRVIYIARNLFHGMCKGIPWTLRYCGRGVLLGHEGLEPGTLRHENISEPKVYLYTSHGTNFLLYK